MAKYRPRTNSLEASVAMVVQVQDALSDAQTKFAITADAIRQHRAVIPYSKDCPLPRGLINDHSVNLMLVRMYETALANAERDVQHYIGLRPVNA